MSPNISPILSLQNSTTLQHHHRMPGPQRNLNPVQPLARTHSKPSHLSKATLVRRNLAVVDRPARIHIRQLLIEHPLQAPLQTSHRLASLKVPMNRHSRPHLQSV